MRAKTGHETPGNIKRLQNDQLTKEIRRAEREFLVESISMNQVARVNKATIRSELSSMRWHTEMPSDQDKAGETPHTLHERRPQSDKDIQQNVQIAYLQQEEQQQESLSGEEQDTGLEGVTGW